MRHINNIQNKSHATTKRARRLHIMMHTRNATTHARQRNDEKMFNNNEIEMIVNMIDETTNNDALTIVDVANTTFTTRDDDATRDEIDVCDMFALTL